MHRCLFSFLPPLSSPIARSPPFPRLKLLWGPLCLLLAFRLIPNKSPYRHPIQMIVSLGQLYGLVLYYLIPIVDEWVGGASKAVSRPEWIYYWGEFIGLNAPWAIVPACPFFPFFFLFLCRGRTCSWTDVAIDSGQNRRDLYVHSSHRPRLPNRVWRSIGCDQP